MTASPTRKAKLWTPSPTPSKRTPSSRLGTLTNPQSSSPPFTDSKTSWRSGCAAACIRMGGLRMAHKKTLKCRTARHKGQPAAGKPAGKAAVKGKVRKPVVKSRVKKKDHKPKAQKAKKHLKRMKGAHKPKLCDAAAKGQDAPKVPVNG
jgi:hypothetical protein